MNNQQFFQSGYPVYEYRLVIRPNEAFRKRLDHARAHAQQHFGWTLHNSAFNHIPVVHFHQFANLETKMIDGLRQVINSLAPYKLEWKQYRATHHQQAIFLEAVNEAGYDFMLRQIAQHRRLMKAGNLPPQFDTHAHFTIGQRLNGYQFKKAWEVLQHKKFQASMIVDSLLLLKRPQGAKAWQIAERFELLNQPVLATSRQGVLFE